MVLSDHRDHRLFSKVANLRPIMGPLAHATGQTQPGGVIKGDRLMPDFVLILLTAVARKSFLGDYRIRAGISIVRGTLC